jgi:hypothetical protein
MRRARVGLAVLCVAAALPLAAQERRGVVEIDHASGEARFILTAGGRTDTTQVGRNPTVRVPRGTPVEVRVVGTNTALYRYRSAQEKVPVPDLESVKSLIIRSAPYMPELRAVAAAIDGRGGEDAKEAMMALAEADRRAIEDATTRVNFAVGKVDRAVQGRAGMRQVQSAVLYSLGRMRAGDRPEDAAAPLNALLAQPVRCGADTPVNLTSTQDLLAGAFEVARAQSDLSEAVAGPGYFDFLPWREAYDSARVVDDRAKAVLDDYEELATAAYQLERLVGVVAGACSRHTVGTLRLTAGSGQTMTVEAVPRGEPEFARVAAFDAMSWTVTVQPRVTVSPSLSIGGLAAPQGRFPIYGTASGGGGTTVAQTGTTDARFTVAGMLGVTWGPLDMRSRNGIAVWLPEVVVGTGRTPTFGVGTAVSWSYVRLGVGAAWMRHRALDGMAVGTVIADPSELRVSDTYGKPRTYVTLSIFDWSPIAQRLR